jgi:hypothetical protein
MRRSTSEQQPVIAVIARTLPWSSFAVWLGLDQNRATWLEKLHWESRRGLLALTCGKVFIKMAQYMTPSSFAASTILDDIYVLRMTYCVQCVAMTSK